MMTAMADLDDLAAELAIEFVRDAVGGHPRLTGTDLSVAVGHALDVVLGGLESVVHRAGPVIEGGQLCIHCGAVLQDWYGAHVGIAVDPAAPPDDHRLRVDQGWTEGTEIWELWRWGEAQRFPRALGLHRGPIEPPDERYCTDPRATP
jgi:hypothetical protein